LETDPLLLTEYISGAVTIGLSTPSVIAAFICIAILLVISAFASASEVAYFSLSISDLSAITSKNSGSSKLVKEILKKPERLLTSLLLTNILVNIVIAVLSAFALSAVLKFENSPVAGIILKIIIICVLILLFGEILPRVYANRHAGSVARSMVYFVVASEKLLYPVSSLIIKSTSIKSRLAFKKQNFNFDDLSDAIELASDDIKDEKTILESIIKFGNIDAGAVMTPRINISAIEITTPLSKLIPLVVEWGYSRIPVYDGDIDSIKGILYTKDLLSHLDKPGLLTWQSLIRPPYYVPENKKIDDLLREFQTKKIHMAIVIDEYGGTGGIITLEDIIEEIVGEIRDESDVEEEPNYQKIDENSFIFDSRILLKDFTKITGIPENLFNDIKGDADTLAGLILEKKGEIPVVKSKIQIKDIVFIIESADKRRIKQIRVILNKDTVK
jgi:magnesium and cobalt exporter, CNNM family